MKQIQLPLTKEAIAGFKAGDHVLLSGDIYTARDQAHKRLYEMISAGKKLPLDLGGITVYYCGPTPSKDRVIGACGPTTSSRMDEFTPALLEAGVVGMIGKGRRSKEVKDAIKKNEAVYFLAPAGAGAYLSGKVESKEIVAFEDLGPEAIYKLTVKDFPVIVAIDSRGKSIYS